MDRPRLSSRLTPLFPGMLLPLILVVALGLRLYGIDWDEGHGFHPDERSIYMRADCMYRVLTEAPGYSDCIRDHPEMEPGAPGIGSFLDADKSPVNPHWFPLGTLLIYLILAIRFIVEPFTNLGSLASMSYVGRSIMALADTGTVLMVYLLGRRMFDRRVGLLAAALVALAVVQIQHSHFYRPEPLLVFFLAASFWSMLQVMERRRLRDSLLLGTFVGLTIALKVSVLPLVLPLVMVYGFRLFTTPNGDWTVPLAMEAVRSKLHALLAALMAVAVFFVTTPYAFLDMGGFIGDITWQVTNVARTAGKVPFTVQYIDTTPYLYELRQTSVWGLGLPLGIVAWGGLVFTMAITMLTLRRAGKAPRGELLLLGWVVPNFILLGLFEVKFLRYIVPIVPFLVLMGSWMLIRMVDVARSIPSPTLSARNGVATAGALLVRFAPHAAIGVVVFVVAATAFYALSFERVYSRPHPAVQASRWINEEIPESATIVTDNHWDEGIPDIYGYKVRQIAIYEPDTFNKMDTMAQDLAQGDYLIFYSNRTYGSVARVPERYPLSSRYYGLLFSGELGYELERSFTSYPQLLGIAFIDDTFNRAGVPEPGPPEYSRPAPISLNLGYADENIIGYDHPKVLLFKNVDGLSRPQLYDLLTRAPPDEAPRLGLMMSPEQQAVQRQGGTWSEIIKRDSWTNSFPILAWLLLVELIYIAALPLATFLFRPLPDRGIILARILGILSVSYVAWMLASLGWLDFSRTSVLVGLLVVASASALVLFAPRAGITRLREFKKLIRGNWRLLAIGELLFLAAFLSFVAIRMANPDLWHAFRGGEKPMDFAYLNAVLRSTSMPPYDPWFAGGYLNYYYWGQFVVATLIKGVGIVPSVAYNLAVPLLFALTVTGAYSLVYNVAAGVRRLGVAGGSGPGEHTRAEDAQSSPTATPGGAPPHHRWMSRWLGGVAVGPVVAGLLAALFVAVIGNLDSIWQILRGGGNHLFRGEAFPSLDHISDYWRSSRMLPMSEEVNPSALTFWLPDRVSPNGEIGHHITEFPFFSFLFADLHAHLIVIPFALLATGLALSVLVGLSHRRGGGWVVAATVALAVAVGSLWAINSWDYPTYLLLAVVFIGLGVYLSRRKPLRALAVFLALAVGMGLLSVLSFLPFHMDYHPFPTGIAVSKWQTPVPNYVGIHGLFLFLIGTFLIYLSRRRLKVLLGLLVPRPFALWDTSASSGAWKGQLVGMRGLQWTLIAGAIGGVFVIYMAAAGYWTAALLSLLLGLTVWAGKDVLCERGERSPYAAFPLLLIALGLLIGIGVEFVRVEDDIGRMNTLFKYYLEAWVLFGMASAYVLWYLAVRGAFRLKGMSIGRGVWLTLLALLLVSSFIYPVLSTRSRVADRFATQNMTLDGADYMKAAVHWEELQPIQLRWDYQAIRWLQDNVEGSPVVLEAHNLQYRWSSRIANYTGLPTVLGWPWHQIQQRMKYNYAIGERISDVEEIYSSADVERALTLLRQYEVEYVVVGQLEAAYYPATGLRKFDTMAQTGLAKLVYKNDGVKIYQALWYN